jgi:hypothetical protein
MLRRQEKAGGEIKVGFEMIVVFGQSLAMRLVIVRRALAIAAPKSVARPGAG